MSSCGLGCLFTDITEGNSSPLILDSLRNGQQPSLSYKVPIPSASPSAHINLYIIVNVCVRNHVFFSGKNYLQSTLPLIRILWYLGMNLRLNVSSPVFLHPESHSLWLQFPLTVLSGLGTEDTEHQYHSIHKEQSCCHSWWRRHISSVCRDMGPHPWERTWLGLVDIETSW